MKDELDKLRALYETATPGPWKSTKYGYEKHSINGDRGVEIASWWGEQNAELIDTMHANWLDRIAQVERFKVLEAAFKLLVDMETALVLTAEHSPGTSVADFTELSAEFGRVKTFLHDRQYDALEQTGADHG